MIGWQWIVNLNVCGKWRPWSAWRYFTVPEFNVRHWGRPRRISLRTLGSPEQNFNEHLQIQVAGITTRSSLLDSFLFMLSSCSKNVNWLCVITNAEAYLVLRQIKWTGKSTQWRVVWCMSILWCEGDNKTVYVEGNIEARSRNHCCRKHNRYYVFRVYLLSLS